MAVRKCVQPMANINFDYQFHSLNMNSITIFKKTSRKMRFHTSELSDPGASVPVCRSVKFSWSWQSQVWEIPGTGANPGDFLHSIQQTITEHL